MSIADDGEELFLLSNSRVITEEYRDRNPIEYRSVLTEEDTDKLKKLKSLRVYGRADKWNARRVRLIASLLENGASAVFFEALADHYPSALIDLMSFLPRSIVRKWIKRTTNIREAGSKKLILLKNECDWEKILHAMLDRGVNCQATNYSGIDVSRNFSWIADIHRQFVNAENGLELILLTPLLGHFLSRIHARNADGRTILQVALKNGHLHTVIHIVNNILERVPIDFVLDPSDAMSTNELLKKSDFCLNDVKNKLKEYIGPDGDVFNQVVAIFNSAAKVLALWQEYEGGKDRFFDELRLAVVEETLEEMEFSKDRAAWYLRKWSNSGKCFIIKVVQVTIITPLEAFLKAIHGAKLHQAVKLDNWVMAAECIRKGANINLVCRDTGMSLIQLAVDLVHVRTAEMLLDSKADVGDAVGSRLRKTLLRVAIEKQSLIIVDAILRNFDDIAIHDYIDESRLYTGTPVHLAARLKRFDIVKLLLKYQATYCKGRCDRSGYSPIRTIEDKEIRDFFHFIDQLFVEVSKGNTECLQRIKNLATDELLAVCNTCDSNGHNLAQIARINKHNLIAEKIYYLMRLKTGKFKSSITK